MGAEIEVSDSVDNIVSNAMRQIRQEIDMRLRYADRPYFGEMEFRLIFAGYQKVRLVVGSNASRYLSAIDKVSGSQQD